MTAQREHPWYKRLKRTCIDPTMDLISDNLPNILAVGTTIAAVGIMIKASSNADEAIKRNEEILASIEDKIQTAIEAPTIVKVELGDDIEVIGYGNRTD